MKNQQIASLEKQMAGSSDTYARVWNACKINSEDSEHPNHEMDLLSGHENDVNYVQFSGCSVASRSSTADTFKEENVPKFKNSWFTHDNIVTCSRDGSAIIWIPRSRRSHGKVGRWTRAYHLKVPPPPLPPQPPRGGPRQRYQPTPRGVNMIVWSLDNRFVLATIMDCRICVWNASDGSLVHSLIGHSESTFVLDVHPFNPRIAMSAGYDGKTIIWDIWEGTPVRIYDMGRFKLVDGKFSPDGTSIILSDEVGQLFIIATGQGESQKDAKYDQFFLGDYRPLIQDTNGNVVDQETQLLPYRRNIQDLLCDSSMIPYPDPYQNMYQQRRLGILGIEWRPSSVKFTVGPTYSTNAGDYLMPPIVDLDGWVEPLPEFLDAIDWEPENEVQSDDNDSEYNVAEEYSSEAEVVSLSSSSSGEHECSAGDSGIEPTSNGGRRRSKRRTHKSEVEFMTSSGRRVKRRNLDERDGVTVSSRMHRKRKSRHGRLTSKKRSTKSKAWRPQRRSARNALNLFSKITGGSSDEEEEEEEEDVDLGSTSAESESDFPDSITQSIESERSMQNDEIKRARMKENLKDEREDAAGPSQASELQANPSQRRRLVLKLPVRESKALASSMNARNIYSEQEEMKGSSSKVTSSGETADAMYDNVEVRENGEALKKKQCNLSAGYSGSAIRWGEVKARSSKRLKLGDHTMTDAMAAPAPNKPSVGSPNFVHNDTNGRLRSEDEHRIPPNSGSQAPGDNMEIERGKKVNGALDGLNGMITMEDPPECNGSITESVQLEKRYQVNNGSRGVVGNDDNDKSNGSYDSGHSQEAEKNTLKFRIRSTGSTIGTNGLSSKLKSVAVEELSPEHDLMSNGFPVAEEKLAIPEDEGTSGHSLDHSEWNDDGSGSLDTSDDKSQYSKRRKFSNEKMYSTVYKRTKSTRGRKKSDCNTIGSSEFNNQRDAVIEGVRSTRSMGTKVETIESPVVNNSWAKEGNGSVKTSRNGGNLTINVHEHLLFDDWKPTSKTVGLRSARNRRENFDSKLRPLCYSKNQQTVGKPSWLTMIEHEECYRYIPQLGDEVAYLRQGHDEYIKSCRRSQEGPLKIKGLKAVEFCRVQCLDYSTLPGSGESCCKLILEFVDPCSTGFGKTFKLTLPELVSYPDFLVERARYDAAIERNWTHRDKCQVWWRNEDGSGNWWEGRILEVKPKSAEFSESPWERYIIKYRSDPSGEHSHSPWELHDAETLWEHPHIDEGSRNKLLECIAKLERAPTNKDKYGIQKLNRVAQKSDYLNRFPVPLSLEVIKRRLENNYYRTLEAVKHDASVMVSNGESYFGKNMEMTTKMRRLSEWVDDAFSSL